MKCKYCRTEISEKALICSNCGRDIEAGEKRKEIPTDQSKRPEENQQSPAKKMNLATRIVLIIVAVAIGLGAGVGLATLVFGGPGTNADSVDYVQSNLNNGGDFAFVGGSIYYIGQDENGDSEDGQATCIMKKSENTAEKILAMDKMTYLNIYQDRIYFKRIEDKKSVIYSAKLDGSDVTELFREDRNLLNLSIASDKIYYITDGKLNRTDLLGQNKETILDGGVETYCVFDRYIYLSLIHI